ncbi:MAG TPA: hypothetical protein VHA56_04290 [Mucilaginibacter sp.]|nr:hypothetical protein [Mucilaginibacter sp.]
MKKLITLAFVFLSFNLFAQDSLKTFNYERINTTIAGMKVLGSWGLTNVAIGVAGMSASEGGANKSFYKMTTIFGAVNVGAAVLGYLQNSPSKIYASKTLKEQKKIELTFLINGGLDIAYLGVGICLNNRGNNGNPNQQGYGRAMIVQSAFLLLFDSTMYGLHRSTGNKLRRFLEKHPIAFDGRSVGIGLTI